MSLRPQPRQPLRRQLFPDAGSRHAKRFLLQAVYFDRTDEAERIIGTDPPQINYQDPFAGVTPLHVAIFRQNLRIVRAISTHPLADLQLRDKFGRRAIDMCIYTTTEEIFEYVIGRTYQKELLELDTNGRDDIIPLR